MSSAMLHAVEAGPLNQESKEADIAQEAARYAVLRRMGSAIRHQIAGSLQPVSMLASMLERRAQAASPDMDALRRNCGEMSSLSRSASSECVALMGWLAPHEGESVPVGQGVEDCLHLLATELSFRGFAVVDAAQGAQALVSRQALRSLLPAALMALTDAAARPGPVRITAGTDAGAAVVQLSLQEAETAEASTPAKAYRPLGWGDVHALARAEGVQVEHDGRSVALRLQIMQPPSAEGDDARWG